MAGRGAGFAETWTAPPPMMAPPQVQAQSFAKAIFTDIIRTLFLSSAGGRIWLLQISSGCIQLTAQMTKNPLSASPLTILPTEEGR